MSRTRNSVSGAIFIIGGICLYVAASEPREVPFADPNAMDIMFYPKILLGIWIAASALYAISPHDAHDWSGLKPAWRLLLKVTACIMIYIFNFSILGLFLSTLIFLLLFFWVLNYRDPKKMIPIALACAGASWFIFEFLLGIGMPAPFFNV